MTERLYQKDVYTKGWEAAITSVRPADPGKASCQEGDSAVPRYEVTLDRSAFFPEGGGQSCDLGSIGSWTLTDVQEDADGEVIHTVEAQPPDVPAPGQKVSCLLDWDRRFDNMQRHCGEHILSGIFYARCGGVNRGFHMGEDYMTIDISLEDDPTDADTPRPQTIDMSLALECERRANQVIWSDAPVTVFRFEDRAEAEKMPLRKALAFDEDISIVCVGSADHAADCVACCGTHPSTAGQVGLIKIYKVENYKGMFRIFFEAGARALDDYDQKHQILTDLSNRYSSSVEDFPDKIRSQEEKLADVKDQLYHVKRALIDKECAALDAVLAGGDAPDERGKPSQETAPVEHAPGASSDSDAPLIVWTLEDLSLDDAFDMAKRYMKKAPKLVLLYARQDTSFILVSNGSPKCGQLVREYASFYQGKGGGNDVSARAIFDGEEKAMLFADLLSKHLR